MRLWRWNTWNGMIFIAKMSEEKIRVLIYLQSLIPHRFDLFVFLLLLEPNSGFPNLKIKKTSIKGY